MVSARLVVAVAASAGVALGAALYATVGRAHTVTPALHGEATWAAGRRPAPEFSLRDQTGALVSLRALHGTPVVLTFMDPRCRSECPLEGRSLASVVRTLPRGQRPSIVIVSVNPAASRLDAVRASERWRLAGLTHLHWLLGARGALRRVWRSYGVTVEPTSNDVVHSLVLYLLDRRGDERAGYLFPFAPQLLRADLRRLALEEA